MNFKGKSIVPGVVLTVFVVSVVLLEPNQAFAGPGGIIAKAVAKSWWVKLGLFILTIIFLPLILYVTIKEKLAVVRAKKALKQLALINNHFRWTLLNERAHAIVTHVYSAWKKADVKQAMNWMTDWYWQNQKLTVLEEWENDGLKNYCKLNKINYIKPLYVEYSERQPGDGEGSRIILLVEVNLQDFLVHEQTGKIVEGDRDNKDLETVWTIVMDEGQWKLTLIEESAERMEYVTMKNDIALASEHLKVGFKYKNQMQD